MNIIKSICTTAICMLSLTFVYSQETMLHGTVYSKESTGKRSLVPGAVIMWEGSSDVILSDQKGHFEIPVTVSLPHVLLVRYTGFTPDTLIVHDGSAELQIELGSSTELKTAEVKGKRESTEISTLKTLNTEKISGTELLKAACCNLSESFETNPSVDVNYSDAITGAKEIQLLGLSGIYTQVLTENIPAIRGLAVPYGINYIPGPWMESIQISKGAGSVANGPEAITGQINVEFKKTEESPPLFINLFGDSEGRTEINTVYSKAINKQWGYMLLLHGNLRTLKTDVNKDGFIDQPLTRLVNIYNRFRYHSGKRLEAQLGIKGLMEERSGGQTQFVEARDKNSTTWYGFGITTRRAEVYSKTGIVYPDKPWKSMGLQNSVSYHDQQSYFGLRNYNATQFSFYTNYTYLSIINTTENKLKSGIDFRYDKYNESLSDSAFPGTEAGPGIYTEYTLGDEHLPLGIIAGMRIDYNNLYGYSFIPRLHLKYNFTDNFIVRLSGGRGLRTPHPFADNIGVFASAKSFHVLESPKREDAWNGGVNITTRFKFNGHDGSLSADAYQTRFINQQVIDQYSQNNAVLFYNLKGKSTATSIQLTLNYEIIEDVAVKLAWKTDDVHSDLLMLKNVAKPLVAKNKLLANIAWTPSKAHWKFDTTLQWEGKKPLPAINSDPSVNDYSPDYLLWMAQVTKLVKSWEFYAGGENLLNYTQKNPVLGYTNPFGNDFDATRVWGPVSGIKIYAGLRVTIK